MKLVVNKMTLLRAGREIVSELSFSLGSGDALMVTGENGAGKSTVLRGIAGLLPIFAGSVYLFDHTGKQFEDPVREYCHYLGHQNAMKSSLSVRENLEFWQKFMGDPLLTVEDALDEVDLLHTIDLPYHYLSSGQKRRAAIARLLVSDRPIWILDEPTSGLDALSVQMFATLANAFCNEGGILIAATHLSLGMKNSKKLEVRAHS